jgi:Ca2+-binding RTX toxin-like protein
VSLGRLACGWGEGSARAAPVRLRLNKQYRDFEAEFEYKIGKGGNSGFYFHVGDKKDPVTKGIEVQIYDSAGQPPGAELTGHDSGGLIPGIPPTRNAAKPAGAWNRMKVTCQGNKVTVVLNGEVVNEAALDSRPIKDRPATGDIGFQDHGLPLGGSGGTAGGAGSPNTTDMTVGMVYVAADPSADGQLALFVGGTSGNDTIVVQPGTTSAYLDVVINGVDRGQFAITSNGQSIDRIIIYGNDGNDTFTVSPKVTIDAVIYGGSGNDVLTGDGGTNFLDGGDGYDVLSAAGGRNVLAGGAGQDTLEGGSGDDILIGGLYEYSEDLDVVYAVVGVWKGSATYAQRLGALRAGGSDGLYAFNTSTILDDGVADQLDGNQGQDWFWAYALDRTDKKVNETQN